MHKLKVFSLLLLAATVMLFAGSINENNLAVNAQATNTKQSHHKKKHVKKTKKKAKTKHKKTTKKKKVLKKHAKKSTKSKKKHQKKSKKVSKTKKKVATHRKKKAPKKVVKKTAKNKKPVNATRPAVIKSNNAKDANYYQSVDGFNFGCDEYATENPSNTLNIPSNYLYSFDNDSKSIVRYSGEDIETQDTIDESMRINVFHPKIADTKRLVDINHIDTNLQRELSQYAADLINQFRLKLSNNYLFTQPLTVTDKALQAANEVADGYNNDKWKIGKGHDVSVLDKVSNKYDFSAYGENMAGSLLTNSYIQGPVNLANVKESIYGAICAMMFDDASSNWGHADNFLAIPFSDQDEQQFGISIDNMGQIHFEIYME